MSNKRLLVIDDSLTIRKLVEISLRATGWNVAFASNGASGVARAITESPDLILLDYVLPDMRGIDVCVQLAASSRTGSIPIVLMTGKAEKVRGEFAEYSTVVDFVGKPFAPHDLIAKIASALERSPKRQTLPSPNGAPEPLAASKARFSFSQAEAAAKGVYAALRGGFAQIPSWSKQLGVQSAHTFYGQKILTHESITKVLLNLLPVYREFFAGATSLSIAPPGADVIAEGRAAGLPIANVLSLLTGPGKRTGECRVAYHGQEMIVHVRQGQVVLATSHDPVDYAKLSDLDVSRVPPAAMAHAQAEQRRSGKPVFVGLTEAGVLTSAELALVIRQQSKRLLLLAWQVAEGKFTFREGPIPSYAEAYGSTITLEQLSLEAKRSELGPADAHDVLDAVWFRREGFSNRVRSFELVGEERLVLASVDGRTTGRAIAQRTKLTEAAAAATLRRLGEVDFIAARPTGAAPRAASGPRRVLVVDDDVEGFGRPLEELLQDRPEPIGVLALKGSADVVAAVARERPAIVLFNATNTAVEPDALLRAIRARVASERPQLVALLDTASPERDNELITAGFDAVLTKPITFSDIERLLAA
jgi:CheY-like chemotaxis protein